MKSLFLFIFILICFSPSLISQKVYTVPYAIKADVVLYETKRRSKGDILIYKVDYASQVNTPKGLWMDVAYQTQADWKVFWTEYRSQADCVVYFVGYRSHARANDCYLNFRSKN